jgi:hypothetical protein
VLIPVSCVNNIIDAIKGRSISVCYGSMNPSFSLIYNRFLEKRFIDFVGSIEYEKGRSR